MNCGMKFVKYSLFAFNLVFFIFAMALIGVGAAVEIKYRSLVTVTGSAISAAPILLICIGVFIFFVSFFGCCGAYKENYCMVSTFAILMALIFILEVGATISAYVLRGKIKMYLEKSFTKSIEEYKTSTKGAFNFVQKTFHCCGSTNESDWSRSVVFQQEANQTRIKHNIPLNESASYYVPDSCCKQMIPQCGIKSNRVLNNKGCVATIEASFKKNIVTVGGIGLAVIFIQIIGFIFSCMLMRTIKSQYDVV
nr:CD63 antigen-like [Ciona intestinalis]|eukprot:XP_002129950.3 CD63 antigen-like [Ciona intestinalis]